MLPTLVLEPKHVYKEKMSESDFDLPDSARARELFSMYS